MPNAADTAHVMLLTTATAIAAGAMLMVLARRWQLPAIVLLLAGGVALGPAVWGPERALVDPHSLGDGLRVIVALAIGLILFEGGLTLDLRGYRSATSMINRLLTIGVLVTWLGTAAVIWLVVGTDPRFAIITGSLVIVTGPTVIGPLLKRIKINQKLHGILHWESVLIDPIGVFIVLLCFEWVTLDAQHAALINLGIRVGWGLAVGVAGGLVISIVVRRNLVPVEMVNVFAFGFAVVVFAAAEAVQSEAGLLAVTVAGFVFGISGTARLAQVRDFKADITDLLIGTLFILLAARLSFEQFAHFGTAGVLAVVAVVALIRPLSILLCGMGLTLNAREKIFLSWVAPRGIVAASIASLVAIRLEEGPSPVGATDPRFVETFTYSVILTTIILQGATAGPLARWLGLQRPEPKGWLVVGAHRFGQELAAFIARHARVPVMLLDTNARAVGAARRRGLAVLAGDARDETLHDRPELQGIGRVLALTDNEDLNVRICQSWLPVVGPDHLHRAHPSPAPTRAEAAEPGRVVWPRLPKPGLIAAELEQGEASLVDAQEGSPQLEQAATTLVTVSESNVTLGPAPAAARAEPARMLSLVRRSDYLLRSMRPELIVRVEAADRAALLKSLVEQVVQAEPAVPREATLSQLIERETAFPTALGHGVAVPHAYCRELPARLCAVASIPGGVDFGAHDGQPVKLVFLLLSPEGDPEGHLACLADIARLVSDEVVRESLAAAATPVEAVEIIRAATGP